jgi:hypothetical protein
VTGGNKKEMGKQKMTVFLFPAFYIIFSEKNKGNKQIFSAV